MKNKKNILLSAFCLLLSAFSLSAQTLTNITLTYSCPCSVTATYTLDAVKATDVVLYYSSDTIAFGWLTATTFSQKSPGTHTDIWDCNAAGVLYGQFYFKLEAVKNYNYCEPTTIDMSMIFVEGGTFTLGAAVQPSTDGTGTNYDGHAETNYHLVTLSTFCMAETPVTQAQFTAVMGINPSSFQGGVYAPSDDKPVEMVSWYDAITFCNKLSLMEGKTPVYSIKFVSVEIDWENLAYSSIPTSYNLAWNFATMDLSANGYRLPTEAEWEYAARGGVYSLTAQGNGPDYFYSGSNSANNVAWYSGNNGTDSTATYGTKPVRQKQPNALGLYDMSGNLWEWCWDWYTSTYTATPVSDPIGPAFGIIRVNRGGTWNISANYTCVSYRNNFPPDYRTINFGFRPVCSSE